MNVQNVKRIRRKQIIIINGFIVAAIMLTLSIIRLYPVTVTQVYLWIGIILLLQATTSIIKINSTKSFIPVFQEVAIYEKEKMGNEWKKQRKVNNIWRIVASGLLFLSAYLSRESIEILYEPALFPIYVVIAIIAMALINVTFYLHIRKVDGANSSADLEGYTKESNITSIVLGFGYVFIVFIIMLYVIFTN